MAKIGVAVFTLNQLALDFDGNCARIVKSIEIAKDNGASIRVGPELEISGYSCEDAFFEADTVYHSWQTVATVIQADFKDILIDLGMPVSKDGSLYNCRVILLNSKILMIRPKTKLANNGNYRENRWFNLWGEEPSSNGVHWFPLPSFISELTEQKYVPFGSDIVLEIIPPSSKSSINKMFPFRMGFEMCEEMWVSDSVNVTLFGERGVHMIVNNSGSYWEIRKLDRALDLMKTATSKAGGLYAFSNLIGCDGSRLCFYGRSLVVLNGKVVAKTTSRETLFEEIDPAFYFLDPLDIVNYRQQYNVRIASHRGSGSRLVFNCIKPCLDEDSTVYHGLSDLTISIHNFNLFQRSDVSNKPCHLETIRPEKEIMFYGSLWLWDYLRRCSSWAKGFIVPLSGGLDSASVACLVYCMCKLLRENVEKKSKSYSEQSFSKALSSILGTPLNSIEESKDICRKLLRCCYLKTKFSGKDSEERAQSLAENFGAEFYSVNFTDIYESINKTTSGALQRPVEKGVPLRLQNLQARLRMALIYDLSDCNRLVLATGNVDEALVGYLTKYDCSSADLNPIGSLSKQDLRKFVAYVNEKTFIRKESSVLQRILDAVPSAELTGENQKDEDDLGLTYAELSLFGRYRRGEFGACGPYSLFCKLWDNREIHLQFTPLAQDPVLLANKVKRFFTLHARNRHKQTILTPALHAETYSPDDNRFDHRQFLFDTTWSRQFKCIDEKVAKILKHKSSSTAVDLLFS